MGWRSALHQLSHPGTPGRKSPHLQCNTEAIRPSRAAGLSLNPQATTWLSCDWRSSLKPGLHLACMQCSNVLACRDYGILAHITKNSGSHVRGWGTFALWVRTASSVLLLTLLLFKAGLKIWLLVSMAGFRNMRFRARRLPSGC